MNKSEFLTILFRQLNEKARVELARGLPNERTAARLELEKGLKMMFAANPDKLDLLFGDTKAKWHGPNIVLLTFTNWLWKNGATEEDLLEIFTELCEWYEYHGIVLDDSTLLEDRIYE
jgi:hypothetical protein